MDDQNTVDDQNTISAALSAHRIERIRHELKRRLLTVAHVENITPKMRRVTLTGDELAGFVSVGYDDHVKLFFPRAGEETPFLPEISPDGRKLVDETQRPVSRDYTPQRYDAARNELAVDFAIHEAGPATRWALQARPGQKLGIAGPRGSSVVADDFDWYLLVGDETALPAIGRRLSELRPQARAIVIVEVQDKAEEQTFGSAAAVTANWLHRGAQQAGKTERLDDALRRLTLPHGDGYAWIACESATARRLRHILLDQHRHPKAWLKAAAYWKLGASNIHEAVDD